MRGFKFILFSFLLLGSGAELLGQSISGFVREDATGEPLFYVNVFIKDTYTGSATNQDGYYVITNIQPGTYEIIASIIGYQQLTKTVTVAADEDIRLNFRLETSVIAGEEVNVTAERIQFQRMVEPSRITLDVREINAMPAFIEPDLFRTLQMLPGVQTVSDFSSALYVRGSTPDQNLIMLDGITVYNPYHIGGIFSTFNTDAIKEADFHAGGFPARWGGRMGSILNVINKQGNTEQFQGTANISALSSKGVIEGPLPKFGKVKGSYMVAGRTTYLDKILTPLMRAATPPGEDRKNIRFPYFFYDYQGKLNLNIGDDHRLTFSQFYGDDVFFITADSKESYDVTSYEDLFTFDWRWGNFTNSLTWHWITSPNLVLKTFLATSRFRFHIDMDRESWYAYEEFGEILKSYDGFFFDVFDIVKDRSLETELTWIASERHMVTTGGQFKDVNFNLGMKFKFASFDTTITVQPLDMRQGGQETALYAQDRWTISDKFTTQVGLRVSQYSIHEKWNLEPRLGMKFFITNDLSFKINWGRYFQYLTIANPRDESFRFIDIWMGIPKEYKAPYSDHTIAGLEYISPQNVLYRLEAYYKSFENLITLKQGTFFAEESGQPQFEPFNEFYDTDAKAYGLEFLAKKTSGKYRGWVGYTFAETQWFTEVDGWFHPKYDRTHTLNAVGHWQWTEKIHLSTALSFSSGNPYTPILGRTQRWYEQGQNQGWFEPSGDRLNDWGTANEYIVGDKNSDRYPPYFRVDMGLTQKKKFWLLGEGERYIQVLNVTNHLNHLMWVYRTNRNQLSDDFGKVQRRGTPMFPLMLTVGWRFEF